MIQFFDHQMEIISRGSSRSTTFKNNKATIPYDTVSNAANIAAANSTALNLVDKFEKQIVGSVYSMNPATIYANEEKNGSAAAIPENPIAIEGFWQRLSYTGYCNNLPLGTTCLINFDPDLNRPVALPVMVGFPRKPDDYACIRVYDANGNGLYDSSDDVYMDISFPGYSSFGTVSVNDVRLSSPSVVT